MTVQNFLLALEQYYGISLFYFAILPVLSFITGLFYKPGFRISSLDYLYSILVYLSGIPGILSAVLTFYSMFIVRKNMLEVNIILYFIPILSMGLVFYLISRKADFNRLPGFGRLSGFMILTGIVCVALLFLYRLSFFIGFFGSIESLLVAGVLLFFVFRYAVGKLSGKNG
ncbi:MAG: hypothetical protein WC799_20580 [Desulfobacteraceae bacterium]